MRSSLIVLLSLLGPSAALADSSRPLKLDTPVSADRPLPRKGGGAQSCAAYGPGFVKVAGTDTCVHVGGSINADTTVRR